MGGKAINASLRMSKDEFFDISQRIKGLVEDYYQTNAIVVPAYRNKESFGDIDLVIQSNNITGKESKNGHLGFRQTINAIGKNDFHINSNIVSVRFEDRQVDLIFSSENMDDVMMEIAYLSYNDLGMLIGLTANAMKLKYGHDGLGKYLYDEKNQYYGTIMLSKDIEEIYTFLGFDYKKWKDGFDNLDDIFDFVLESKYFNPKYYRLESMNRDKKDRTKKRPNYQKFMELVESMDFDKDYPTLKNISLQELNVLFPKANVLEKHDAILANIERSRFIKSKFNGLLILEWFGVESHELSGIINRTKDSFSTKEEFESFVLENDLDAIKNRIALYVKKES